MIDQYTILEKIGSGSYGVVYKAQDNESNILVAIKSFKQDENVTEQGCDHSVLREIVNMSRMKHKNILKILNIHYNESQQGNKYFLVFPYYEQDLHQFIKLYQDGNESIKQLNHQKIFQQLLEGLQALHFEAIMHRDIKPSNILIDRDQNVVIADFGLSRPLCITNQYDPITYQVVTLCYRAPELLLGSNNYSSSIDIWSMGCVFAAMILGENLFNESSQIAMLFQQFRQFGTPNEQNSPSLTKLPFFKRPLFPVFKSEALQLERQLSQLLNEDGASLILMMLRLDPQQRISASEALQHKFFKSK